MVFYFIGSLFGAREIGVIVEVEASLDVDAMSENFSLFLKLNYFSKK